MTAFRGFARELFTLFEAESSFSAAVGPGKSTLARHFTGVPVIELDRHF